MERIDLIVVRSLSKSIHELEKSQKKSSRIYFRETKDKKNNKEGSEAS